VKCSCMRDFRSSPDRQGLFARIANSCQPELAP
jgi:hypothetical protein